MITLLATRSWRRSVARLTVLSRSSREILSSAATSLQSVRSAHGYRGLRESAKNHFRVSTVSLKYFRRPSSIRSPITFIDRPRYHGLSRTERFFSIADLSCVLREGYLISRTLPFPSRSFPFAPPFARKNPFLFHKRNPTFFSFFLLVLFPYSPAR